MSTEQQKTSDSSSSSSPQPIDEEKPTRLEPWMELPESSLNKVKVVTDAIHKATDTPELNLKPDCNKVNGQNFICLSFVSPTGNQKSKFHALMCRGVFNTYEEATEHVKQTIKLDPTFDIFICSTHEWLLVPPDPELIKDQVHMDKKLNDIISGYRYNQIYAKEHFEERKREMVEQAAEEARRAALEALKNPPKLELVGPPDGEVTEYVSKTEPEETETVIVGDEGESNMTHSHWGQTDEIVSASDAINLDNVSTFPKNGYAHELVNMNLSADGC